MFYQFELDAHSVFNTNYVKLTPLSSELPKNSAKPKVKWTKCTLDRYPDMQFGN